MNSLVSCVMPTTMTREVFHHQAVQYFLRQSYPNIELIVVAENGSETIVNQNILVVNAPVGSTIGAKMNVGIEEAQGNVVVKLDDDDWYAPDFVARMVISLKHRSMAVAAVATYVSFLIDDWKLRYSGGANAFAGATLTFTKETWKQRPFLENIRVGEDLEFCRGRQKIAVVPPPWIYMMVRHGRNTWNEWQGGSVEDVFRKRPPFPQTPEEFLRPDDLAFYKKLAEGKK